MLEGRCEGSPVGSSQLGGLFLLPKIKQFLKGDFGPVNIPWILVVLGQEFQPFFPCGGVADDHNDWVLLFTYPFKNGCRNPRMGDIIALLGRYVGSPIQCGSLPLPVFQHRGRRFFFGGGHKLEARFDQGFINFIVYFNKATLTIFELDRHLIESFVFRRQSTRQHSNRPK